jgi:hypothetical protein
MTTAADIIFDALLENGVIGVADPVPAEYNALCLRKLNQLLERLSNSRLAFPTLTEITVTLTSAQTYLIGPGGATATARPLSVSSATSTDPNGLDRDVDIITREEWLSIGQKDLTGGYPLYVWYDATNTNGTLYVYPKSPGYTLKLSCQTLLASFANVATDLDLPEGYATLLTLMLADDTASAFSRQTSPDTRRRLNAARAAISTTNAAPVYLDIGMERQPYDIRTDI